LILVVRYLTLTIGVDGSATAQVQWDVKASHPTLPLNGPPNPFAW